jgi:hypothetical protein
MPTKNLVLDYPLQGSKLDVPLETVLSMSEEKRQAYVLQLLDALAEEIAADRMSLKTRISFTREMRDLRKLLHSPADMYLYTDEKTRKRNVLGKGSPGSSHTYWSRSQMWKMVTKQGDLLSMIINKDKALIRALNRLFDPANTAKEGLRNIKQGAIKNALRYFEFDKSGGTAFPPFHAKFFADRYLPIEGDSIVVDPCAGWGGRLLGTLSVNRSGYVQYYGVDPEKRNKAAYDGLERRINTWLERELPGKRSAHIFYKPFEDWISSAVAKKLFGRADLVITSPPYFSAENYNPSNKKQSANRYITYEEWREKFYFPLMRGAFSLLKNDGTFVLNIADVAEAPRLERDARKLATEVGFDFAGFYKMAMSICPGTRKQKVRHAVKVNGSVFKHEPVFCFRKPQPISE